MNQKWSSWIYPIATLIGVAIILIFVLTSSGCSPQSKTEHSSTTQAYASESTSAASGQILVCSRLGQDNEPIDFPTYVSVIWVEPVTQNVFSVYYTNGDTNQRTIAGPLQGWRYGFDDAGGPISFPEYQKKAEKAGYTLVYEE